MWLEILAWLKKFWYVPVIGLLLTTNMITNTQYKHVKSQLVAEQVAHKLDNENFKQAQALADKQAKDKEELLKKESKANAEKADASYSTLLGKYNASLLRYKTNQSGTIQPDYHQLPTPQGSDGPSPSPQFSSTISITIDDAQICAVNTARLQAVHDWATSSQK